MNHYISMLNLWQKKNKEGKRRGGSNLRRLLINLANPRPPVVNYDRWGERVVIKVLLKAKRIAKECRDWKSMRWEGGLISHFLSFLQALHSQEKDQYLTINLSNEHFFANFNFAIYLLQSIIFVLKKRNKKAVLHYRNYTNILIAVN